MWLSGRVLAQHVSRPGFQTQHHFFFFLGPAKNAILYVCLKLWVIFLTFQTIEVLVFVNKIDTELGNVLLSRSQDLYWKQVFDLLLHIYSFLLLNQNSWDQLTSKIKAYWLVGWCLTDPPQPLQAIANTLGYLPEHGSKTLFCWKHHILESQTMEKESGHSLGSFILTGWLSW